jgi:hypothetical protein
MVRIRLMEVFKPSVFNTLAASSAQYSTNLYSRKTYNVFSDASQFADASSVSLLLPTPNATPQVFGTHSWLPPGDSRSAEYAVRLYNTSTSSLTNAMRLTPSQAIYSGTVEAQALMIRNWRVIVDTATSMLLFQHFEGGGYVTKTAVSTSSS